VFIELPIERMTAVRHPDVNLTTHIYLLRKLRMRGDELPTPVRLHDVAVNQASVYLHSFLTTEMSHSGEATNCADTQEFPSPLKNRSNTSKNAWKNNIPRCRTFGNTARKR
jgi:hypothetical protein